MLQSGVIPAKQARFLSPTGWLLRKQTPDFAEISGELMLPTTLHDSNTLLLLDILVQGDDFSYPNLTCTALRRYKSSF